MFQLSPHLWAPQRHGIEQAIGLLKQGHDLCLYGPTGSGKTVQAMELTRWGLSQGNGVCFYVNRKLLVGQSVARFQQAGIQVGVRAAEYEDMFDPDAPVQICSADTERARVMKEGNTHGWDFHDAGLVIIDELHIQRAETMQAIVKAHRENGARIVGLSATPIGVNHMVNNLVISGTMQQYRDCNALVTAVVKSIEQPDLRKIKRNSVGEYVIDGRKKKIYVQDIISNVIGRWKQYNPDARQALAYWPGVKESIWGTKQFTDIGVPWAHVDANDAVIPERKLIDGQKCLVTRQVKLTRKHWAEILQRFEDGDIVGISSRMKLREGVDVPFVYHLILATPIGSVASAIQTVGRGLRYSPQTPDHVLITDHGGVYWTHGSPNVDKPWREWWYKTDSQISQERERGIKEHGEKEPMRCAICEGEFLRVHYQDGSPCCPHCKTPFTKSRRSVRQLDGNLVDVDGPLLKPPRTKMTPTVAKDWERMFWSYWRNGKKRTFAQMEAWFTKQHGFHPPRTVPFMPKDKEVWNMFVHTIPLDRLTLPDDWRGSG